MTTQQPTLSLMGELVEYSFDELPIDKLLLMPDNPRIYAAVRKLDDFNKGLTEQEQKRILELMLNESSVNHLMAEIRRDGGLQVPIVVRWDTRQVIDGNSRLAVYRKLKEEGEDGPWEAIPCQVIAGLTQRQQARLLAQAHLRGQTEWTPQAKALYCYRWVEEEKVEVGEFANLSGFTAHDVTKNVEAVSLMGENADEKQTNFSYYNAIVRNPVISSEIKNNVDFRTTLFSQIKGAEMHFTAQQMRDRLPKVIAKPKLLRKYSRGDVSLEVAYDRARQSTAQQRLRDARGKLEDVSKKEILRLEPSELGAVKQQVKYVCRAVKRIAGALEEAMNSKSS